MTASGAAAAPTGRPGTYLLGTADPNATLREVAAWLEARRIVPLALRFGAPSLEEVFLRLTGDAGPDGGPLMHALAAQLRMELRLTVRRGENLVVTLGIPLLLLVFLANVDLVQASPAGPSRLDQLVPGILCLALISTGLVSLGIATAFERGNGTLKRLASSPLPRWALMTAKTAAVTATVARPGGGA